MRASGVLILLWLAGLVSPSLASAGGTDPLALTPEARFWFRQRVPAKGDAEQRLRALAAVMTLPGGLDLREDRRTRTASETFEAQRGNCVGFAFLFVAAARELGLPAYFVLSETVEERGRRDDLVVEDLHLAAAYGPPDRPMVFDLGTEDRPGASFRPISDLTASAIFYSNRGVELLQAKNEERALELLEIAVEQAPNLPLIWTNLGVIRRRLGDTAGADAAFRQAILLAPDSLAAWKNLALLLDASP
ncbi:MAG: hypothetical protein KDD47_28220 [Acidobacteria bacterium]|nr:hypothetical protein [Acidobacteriota bacterium]